MKFFVFLSFLVLFNISSFNYVVTQIALPMPIPLPLPGMAYPHAGAGNPAAEDDYDEIAYATEAMTMGTKNRVFAMPQARVDSKVRADGYQSTQKNVCDKHTSTFIPGAF